MSTTITVSGDEASAFGKRLRRARAGVGLSVLDVEAMLERVRDEQRPGTPERVTSEYGEATVAA